MAEDVAVTNYVGDTVYHLCHLHHYYCVRESHSLVLIVRLVPDDVFLN